MLTLLLVSCVSTVSFASPITSFQLTQLGDNELSGPPLRGGGETVEPTVDVESGTEGEPGELAGDVLESLEFIVSEVEGGKVMKRSGSSGDWSLVEEGESIDSGKRIVTLDGASATLTIPGIAVMELGPGSVLEVDNLDQYILDKSKNLTADLKVNEIEVDVPNGDVKAKVMDNEGEKNDVKVKTLHSVAGIRGTSFQCESRPDESSCSVLNGKVRFASRSDTSRFRNLGPGATSRMRTQDDEPSDPEPIDPEQREELEEFEKKANRLLAQEVEIQGLRFNQQDVPRDGEGRFHYEMNYRKQRNLRLAVDLTNPGPDTAIQRLVLRREGEERVLEDGPWVFSLTPSRPEEGERNQLNYTIFWEDANGNRSRSVPFQLTLVHPQSHGVLPGGLEQSAGAIPIRVEQIGGQDARSVRFPYQLTTKDLADLKLGEQSDTGVLSEDGIVVRGMVDSDSPLAGVAYRLRDGAPWQLASAEANWRAVVPVDEIRSMGGLSLQLVAWTTDGYQGEIVRVGPFEFESRETAFPVDYSTDASIRIELQAIAGQSISASDLPFSITSHELGDNQLTVRGTARADSAIEGFAFRPNNGRWQNVPQPAPNWEIALPTGSSSVEYSLDVLAWTKNETLSEVRTFGPIQYEYIESTVPTNYDEGEVPVEFQVIEGFDVSNAEFPFHLYKSDVSEGITINGVASGDTTIEGVAYSTDGGQNWTRAEGGESWFFTIPAEETTTYDQIQVVAWTTAGVRGQPVELGTVEYDNRKFTTLFKDIFSNQWNNFEKERLSSFLMDYSISDYQFADNLTGIEFDYSQFERLAGDFFNGVRNLRTFRNIERVLSGESGGEIIFDLEWRGTANDPDRPFLVTGSEVTQQFSRRADGQFEIVAMKDFPPILYLFNKRDIRIEDLKGIIVKTLTPTGTDNADVIYHAVTPDLTVNKIVMGGPVADGGIQEMSGGFSSIRSIPDLGNGYGDDAVIHEGRVYAVNIRSESGEPSTALIKVVDVRSGFVEVQIISAQSFPGQPEEPFIRYRGVVPFDQ